MDTIPVKDFVKSRQLRTMSCVQHQKVGGSNPSRVRTLSRFPGMLAVLVVTSSLLAVSAAQNVGKNVSTESLGPGQPNVCPYQDVTMVLVRQPCVQAFTRLVKVWKPNCGYTRNWCVGYERRTHYYTTYKDRYQPQQVTKYRCCNGWQLGDQGSSCNNRP
ncbi:EGF-like and EMI domain-containing protein 1, partial [Aplysia californica]|uniref:EGF-like and EMI domain-containing protein 1 n=1 Tax=Aplysia californica TaxID=6500 RepID=A0ABM0ZVM7_APLCA